MADSPPFKVVLQLITLFLFILLLFITVYPISSSVPYDLFLRLDPLAAIGSIIGSGRIAGRVLFSLIIVALTILAGRLFCGYLCPLGTVIDISDGAARKQHAREENRKFRNLRSQKYYLLFVVIVSGLLGFSLFYAFDPVSVLTRTFTSILYPFAVLLGNLFLDLIRPLADRMGWLVLANASLSQPVYGSNFVTFFIVVGIIALGHFSRRFWCRYLCPLGALLGLLSWLAPIRRKVLAGCTDCGVCQVRCPMDAIKNDPRKTTQAECIGCRICERVCPENVVKFTWGKEKKSEYRSEIDFSRRGFIYAAVMALSLPFLAYSSPARARRERKSSLIRPPGSLPEQLFNRTCIRCGECVKSCITNTLQPSAFEAGLGGLWTPRHVMRLAGCEQACNVCGQVCPTQAIRALPLEEKRHARIGTAVLLRDKCLAWEQDRLCLICDEACPYNAIVFRTFEGQKRPFVDELKCNGCGICEQVCPVFGESAIVVEPMGQIRLKEGSYIEESKQMKLELKLKELKDEFQENGTPSLSRSRSPSGTPETLPPGFTTE